MRIVFDAINNNYLIFFIFTLLLPFSQFQYSYVVDYTFKKQKSDNCCPFFVYSIY